MTTVSEVAEGDGARSARGDAVRSCGACTACCTVVAVTELRKGPYQPCTHVGGSGCGIYAERPASCRRFECQWLRGVLEVDGRVDPALRPDACGVVIDYQPDSAFGELYTAWEVEPGASAVVPAKDILQGLAETFLVLVVTPGPDGVERRFVGPDHRVHRAIDVLWSRGPGAPRGGFIAVELAMVLLALGLLVGLAAPGLKWPVAGAEPSEYGVSPTSDGGRIVLLDSLGEHR